MKIIIIGSGIAGLSVYHFLRKHLPETHTIKVYEAFPKSIRAVGGGLGLAPNGVRVLHALDPAIVNTKLLAPSNSFHNEYYSFRNAYGKSLTRLYQGRSGRYGFPNTMTARAVIYSALEDNLPAGTVTHGKRVARINETESGVEVHFEDGSVESADFVIGADGVRSIVRPAIVGEGYEAEYRGLTGIGGFIPLDPLPEAFKASLQEDPIVMTFGRDGFFGYAPCCSLQEEHPQMMWWSTFSSETPPPRDLPVEKVREQLLGRHEEWVSPDGSKYIAEVIKLATNGEREVLVLPTWITPHLPTFHTPSGRVVLIGDAAHAMPPDSGQGASLALEDSQTIALLLEHFLKVEEGEQGALRRTAEAFEEMRKGRAETVLKEAKKRGDRKKVVTWWEEWMRDWLIWGVGFIPEGWQDWKFSYTVKDEVEKYLAAH